MNYPTGPISSARNSSLFLSQRRLDDHAGYVLDYQFEPIGLILVELRTRRSNDRILYLTYHPAWTNDEADGNLIFTPPLANRLLDPCPRNDKTYTVVWLVLSPDPIDRNRAST